MKQYLFQLTLIFMVCSGQALVADTPLNTLMRQIDQVGYNKQKEIDLLVANWSGTGKRSTVIEIEEALFRADGPSAITKHGNDKIILHNIIERLTISDDVGADALAEFLSRQDTPSHQAFVLTHFEYYPHAAKTWEVWKAALDDKRVCKPYHTEQPGSTLRMCDLAHRFIVNTLAVQHLIKQGDPGYGDAFGSNDYEERDADINIIKAKLNGPLHQAIIDLTRPPVKEKSELVEIIQNHAATVNPLPQPVTSAKPFSKLWLVWLLPIFAALGSMFWLMRKAAK